MEPSFWKPIEEKIRQTEPVEMGRREAAHRESVRSREKEQAESEGESYRFRGSRLVLEEDLAERERLTREVEDAFGEDGSAERTFVTFQRTELAKALRQNELLEAKMAGWKYEEDAVLGEIGGKAPTSVEQRVLRRIRDEIEEVEQSREVLLESSPEAYYGVHLRELKKYRDQVESGRIVETPSVRAEREEIEKSIRATDPVFIYGHLGSGKTELALHAAQEYLIRREAEKQFDDWQDEHPDADDRKRMAAFNSLLAENRRIAKDKDTKDDERFRIPVISGSKHLTVAELYGYQTLSLAGVNAEESEKKYQDFLEKYAREFEKWMDANPDASETEKDRQAAVIRGMLQEQLAGEYASGTVSKFNYGPIYDAMEKGKPIIIDEVNAIPHELLISLNHILTRKPGEKVTVQQNGGREIVVAEGFAVIMTGNLNQDDDIYVGRQDLDPAFLSRIHNIKHGYLPQEEKIPFNALAEETEGKSELFQVMLAGLLSEQNRIAIPEGAMRKLWNLAKAGKAVQDVFSGVVREEFFFKEGGARPIEFRLRENVLSVRGIERILDHWKSEGYEKELDYYVFKYFVAEATNAREQAYLYQLFHDQFGFFSGSGWEQSPDYGNGGAKFLLPEPDEKKMRSAEKIEVFGPRDIVDMTFGKGPERKEWPKDISLEAGAIAGVEMEHDLKELEQFEAFSEELAVTIGSLESLFLSVCPLE